MAIFHELASSKAMGRHSSTSQFSGAGAEKMRQAMASHRGGLLAILVHGDVVAAPILTEPISTSVVISGNSPRAEAERLANGLAIR
jgi:preprotein translocase subunit SecD